MLSSNMSLRERWLAFMDAKPVDRLPFWAKTSDYYINHRKKEGDAVTEPVPGSPWQWSDDCIINQEELWQCDFKDDLRRESFTTPSGTAELIYRYDSLSGSYYPEKHAISTLEDIKVMTEWFLTAKPALDPQRLKNALQASADMKQKESGINSVISGASPFLYYVVHLAGLENANLLMMDYPEEIEALLNAALLHMESRLKLHLEQMKPDVCLFVENMSTMLVSPNQFHDYVLPHIKILNDICNRHNGRMAMQMPGHISAILDDLSSVDSLIIEGVCSPPVGDTSLDIMRSHCPDSRIAGGTNAALWMKSAESVIRELSKNLDAMPHHRGVAVTSSDMIPPATPFDTIIQVADFINSYPPKV
jgi:uroporphyrinogen-III decarboxylase